MDYNNQVSSINNQSIIHKSLQQVFTNNLRMELSKEVYPKSPERKDIQSVVNDLLQDEKIVGKKKKNEKKKNEKNEL